MKKQLEKFVAAVQAEDAAAFVEAVEDYVRKYSCSLSMLQERLNSDRVSGRHRIVLMLFVTGFRSGLPGRGQRS